TACSRRWRSATWSSPTTPRSTGTRPTPRAGRADRGGWRPGSPTAPAPLVRPRHRSTTPQLGRAVRRGSIVADRGDDGEVYRRQTGSSVDDDGAGNLFGSRPPDVG